MSFIRAKEIPPHSGNWYDYEVKGVREGQRVRQIHIVTLASLAVPQALPCLVEVRSPHL